MSDALNIHVPGHLEQFVAERIGPDGLYLDAGEYIRDLIRRDYEQEESARWARLCGLLRQGIEAPDQAFTRVDAPSLLAQARREKQDRGVRADAS